MARGILILSGRLFMHDIQLGELNYVQINWLERCYGVGPESVDKRAEYSSKIGDGFQIN